LIRFRVKGGRPSTGNGVHGISPTDVIWTAAALACDGSIAAAPLRT
jgi:hypothetical protein